MATQALGSAAAGLTTSQIGCSSSLSRRMDGGPCCKFWDSPETISQLETVRSWIGKHYKKVSELTLTLNSRGSHNVI